MVTVLSVFMLSAPLVSGHAAADVVQVFTCLLTAHSLCSPVVSDASLLDLDRNPGAREQRESHRMCQGDGDDGISSSAMSPCLRS